MCSCLLLLLLFFFWTIGRACLKPESGATWGKTVVQGVAAVSRYSLWNMAEGTQNYECPNMFTFLKTTKSHSSKRSCVIFFLWTFHCHHCQKNCPWAPVTIQQELIYFQVDFSSWRTDLIKPSCLPVSHSGAHSSDRHQGSIWQSSNCIRCLRLTAHIIVARNLNFRAYSGIMRTLSVMLLGYFFRNYNIDSTNSASRNNPLCISILKKSLYLIEISCHQSGTCKTRTSNSEIIENQRYFHSSNCLCSMRTSLLASVGSTES